MNIHMQDECIPVSRFDDIRISYTCPGWLATRANFSGCIRECCRRRVLTRVEKEALPVLTEIE